MVRILSAWLLVTFVVLALPVSSFAQWRVSAELSSLTADGVAGHQVVGVVVSVLDENGQPVSGLHKAAFQIRGFTTQINGQITKENNNRLGKPYTIVIAREMELPGTYSLQTDDTYSGGNADEVLSESIVVLQVYTPAKFKVPEVLRAQIVLKK